ncbi:zinc finger protein [Macleaya cordata]|uniref:Zinc finger protein n=1 Tax=Macleaya cordata TaxID=56857 RepID=A0A200Q0C8_MACCD|nr:zinc finger protein [Macleaya cordata]
MCRFHSPLTSVLMKIAKTGALCCVAAGPHGTKPSTGSRDYSTVPGEPHWRTNSSFSPPPPPSRRWDCRFQSDGLPRESNEATVYCSSLSSNGKRSRSRVSSDQYANHQHSISDGVVSYSGSPSDNFQAPRWTPPQQKFDYHEFPTPSVEASRSGTSLFPLSAERRFTGGASAASNSFRSPSSLSESSQWESTSKQPVSLPHRTFSSRRSFLSKPVYPLVFRNPVSDGEAFGSADISCINRLTPCGNTTPSHWPTTSSSLEHKFHKTLTELQRMEGSPDCSMSSRREGFRWSNASSYDLGFDGESFDVAEHVDLENPRSPNCTAEEQKCVLCGRLLSQKSPWSSYRIVRGGDMPIAGVLSCSHVFHAECLEQTTPKAQLSDPPCPLCLKTIGAAEESSSVSEPLQMALRSLRRNRGVVISDGPRNNESDIDRIEGGLRRNRSLSASQQHGSSSLIKSHLKKHLSFKGKSGKDFFGTKVFRRIGSSSSSQDPVGCSRSIRSWRK